MKAFLIGAAILLGIWFIPRSLGALICMSWDENQAEEQWKDGGTLIIVLAFLYLMSWAIGTAVLDLWKIISQ